MKRVKPMPRFSSWNSYREFEKQVRHERRYFQDAKNKEFLEVVRETCRSRAKRLEQGSKFWRAQVGSGTRPLWDENGKVVDEIPGGPLPPDRMVPHPSKVSEGRGNPRGIAYLYLSTKKGTAIAEVRPWVGAEVSIGVFEIVRELVVVDCRVGKEESYLYLEGPPPRERWDELVWASIDRAFARPVEPGESGLAYAPTQILAELFLSEGYDGVGYKSALSDGHNAMLFHISAANLIACYIHRVTQVSYDSNEIEQPYFRDSRIGSGDQET